CWKFIIAAICSRPWTGPFVTARILAPPSNASWPSPRRRRIPWTGWPTRNSSNFVMCWAAMRCSLAQAKSINTSCSLASGRRLMAMTRSTTATEMKQDLPQRILKHLDTLGVPLKQQQLDRMLREGEQAGWSYLQLLDRLFGEQADQKQERLIVR